MLDVTPYKQSDDSRCGPASIRMVLDYYNVYATEDELAVACNHTYEVGCTDKQMKAAFESYGFKCDIKEHCTIKDLKGWVDKGIPVIVDWLTPGVNPGLTDTPCGHSSVVIGCDDDKVYLLDPESAQVRDILHNDFMRVWIDWRNCAYVSYWSDMVVRQAMIAYPAPKRKITGTIVAQRK